MYKRQVIQLDPDSKQLIDSLADKNAQLIITDWNITLYLLLQTDGIKLSFDQPSTIDTKISGKLFDLLNTGIAKGDTAKAFEHNIDVSGDIQLAEKIQAILKNIDIDLEEQLSKITGDTIAHNLGLGIKNAKSSIKKGLSSLIESGTEFAQEEAKITPTHSEVDQFYQEVRTIRDDVERLEARINLLEVS